MKVVSVVGARPEFVQAAPLSRALGGRHPEVLVHTGQHYDFEMSEAFFQDLDLPAPSYNLDIGSGPRGSQIAAMLPALEDVLRVERPDWVIVRGDTNSTLAGALAASRLKIPLAHIEAGERSFDRTMPEEINRILVDDLAALHLCVSQTAADRLIAAGRASSVHWVGDVMLDSLDALRPFVRQRSQVLERLGLEAGQYALVTIHRAANTDDPVRLNAFVSALNLVEERIVFPVHPRTRTALDALGARLAPHVLITDPIRYLDMLALEEHARLIATDSGGVQREAYFMGVPCLTLRDETEWVETVTAGWNRLVGADVGRILSAWTWTMLPSARPPIFGDGHAADRIVHVLEAVPLVRRDGPGNGKPGPVPIEAQ